MKTKYVAGFFFNEEQNIVALIRKNRPAWQAGKLNAIGGKTELGESALQAMKREFWEEAGVLESNWREFCVIEGPNFEVTFFVAFGDVTKLVSKTDEKIELFLLENLEQNNYIGQTISNLKWLIPLALDKDQVVAYVKDPSINK